jgi:hypothetical protein
MDALMQSSQSLPNQYQTWDYQVTNGIVPIIDGVGGDQQAAMFAAFIQTGTIPQIPESGTPWVEFFTGTVSFSQIDNQIKSNLNALGLISYYPQYDFVNGNLVAKVVSQ